MATAHVTLTISGGGPYGVRLTGAGKTDVVVDKVRKSGKADEAGLREGDVIQSVNGRTCRGVDPGTVSQWMDTAGQKLVVQVVRRTSDAVPTSTVGPSQDEARPTVTLSRAQPDHLEASDRFSSTKEADLRGPSVTGSNLNDYTITAPSGVDIQRNVDKSFTVTLGMPFQMDLGQSSETKRQSSETKHHEEDGVRKEGERFSSRKDIVFDNYKKEDAKQPQQQQQPQEEPMDSFVPPSSPPLRGKQLEKILGEGSGSEPSTPASADAQSKSGKKLFVDSAFYDDPQHKYPTVDEQIQLARQVAMSVISPANLKSRGHRMFMKRKERAIRWTTGLSEEEKAELAAKMAAAKAAEAAGEPVDESFFADAPQSPQSGSLSLPASVVFAPKLPTDKNVEKLNAMSNEELERMQLLERKTTHTNVSPQVCFSLVDDLKSMKGKGGKLFAKRQARVEKLQAGKSGGQREEEGEEEEEEGEEEEEEPDQNLAERVKAQHQLARSTGNQDTGPGGGAVPVNRLKGMVEVQKAAMTPWDAVAQYGSVDKAFEHLDKSGQQPLQSLADSLQQKQQQLRKVEKTYPTGPGRGNVRPKSTIGGVGMGRGEATSPGEQQSKIEALGGNPNAAGLAAAMRGGLASARSSGLRQRPGSRSSEAT